MQENVIFSIIILIFSVVIHEVAHGAAAYKLGDPTAKLQGRLSLNPIRHIDPFGSVILPLLLVIFNTGFILGWAKPVPYNPYNLRNQRWGEAIVAGAGPASNLVIALIFGLLIRFGLIGSFLTEAMFSIFSIIVIINVLLAVFNLIPIPPLDGSKLLFSVLPYKYLRYRRFLEQYGLILVLVFVIFFWAIISPIISGLYFFLTGVPII